MIAEIEKVPTDRVRLSFPFPAVDFKFINRGTATALIWKVGVEVCHARLDTSPALSFDADVNDGALVISGTDHGWGSQHELRFSLREPVLDRVFGVESLQFTVLLNFGEESTRLAILSSKLNGPALGRFRELAVKVDKAGSGKRLFFQLPERSINGGISLGRLRAEGVCVDYQGVIQKIEADVSVRSFGHIYLNENGFEYWPDNFCYSLAPSREAFISIIDLTPAKTPYEKTYAISRQIAPGDVERFHVVLGATKSCKLAVRFKFYIDTKQVVVSNPIEISVYRPRNRQIPEVIKDGAEFINQNGVWVLPAQKSWEAF